MRFIVYILEGSKLSSPTGVMNNWRCKKKSDIVTSQRSEGVSDSFIEQNLDRANFERSADLEMDESNNTFKHAQLEGTNKTLERSDLLEL